VKRDDLYQRLDERLRDPARAQTIDDALWRELGAERAVLVSDLSGFTRLTKQKGILHFLCAFRRVCLEAEEVFRRNGVLFWKTDADNLMAAFAEVEPAVQAAAALARTDFGDVRCCLGIGWGRILQLEDDLFGDQVNVAYKLGEDIADPGQVLLSAQAAALVDAARLDGPDTATVGGLELPYFRLQL